MTKCTVTLKPGHGEFRKFGAVRFAQGEPQEMNATDDQLRDLAGHFDVVVSAPKKAKPTTTRKEKE